MKFFVVAVALIAARATAAVVGGDKCRYGPTFWCSSIQAASSCNAFTHCLQTVWERQLIDVQQTEVCLSSEELVDTARRVRSVDGEIQAPLVTSLCNSADNKQTKEQCQATVTRFLPQVLSLLESNTESSSVAALLGLCQLYDDEPAVEAEHTADMCQHCHSFLADARQLLKRPEAEKEVASFVERRCSQFSDLEIWCKAVVGVGVPRLFKFLEENDGADMLCDWSSLCLESEDGKLKDRQWSDVMVQLFDDIEMDSDREVICHDCEKVLTSLLAFEKESTAKMYVEHSIAHLCSMTSLKEETCRLLSEGLGRIPEHILHTVSLHLDVPRVCEAMVGCTGAEPEPKPEPKPDYDPIAPAGLHAPPMPDVFREENQTPESPYCMECMRLFEDIRHALKMDRSLSQDIAQAKQTLCQNMGTLETQCHNIVEVFVPMMIDWLTTKESPLALCSQLSVCPKPKDTKTMDFVKMFGSTWSQDTLSGVGSFLCDECQVIVEDARAADRNPDFQKAIVDFFNGLCDKLGQEATQCKALVEQYAPQLFEIIASELEPTVVCELLLQCTKPEQQAAEHDEPVQEIPPEPEALLIGQQSVGSEPGSESENEVHLTKKAKKAMLESLRQKSGDSLKCSLCEMVMEKIDNTVASNKTEAELSKLLEDACSLVPGNLKDLCDELVDSYTPTIIQLLLQQLDPHLICDELELCQKDLMTGVVPPPEDIVEEEIAQDVHEEEEEEVNLPRETIECQLCELVMESIDKAIAQNRTEAVVEKALDEVCSVIPDKMQSQCLSFVDQYAAVVVQLIVQELQPLQVCTFLTLCQQQSAASKEAVNIAVPESKDTSAPSPRDANASHNRKQTSDVSNEEVCIVCQTVANFLKEALNEQSTVDEVEKLLDDICNLLPNNFTATCNTLVKQFTPLVLKLLAEKDNPLELCKELKMCSADAHEGRLKLAAPTERVDEGREAVGVDACTYGPSFWCANMDNARQCGMVQECVEKYGMKP
ncbi:uncharacterized protein LOC143285942 [Babylonia areolata]|uniref:uncharacterized protein LOC143285942 n=1 Tax=Babylonia areolata TaxID=304850 RepID=UPI003FCF109F